MNIEIRVSAAEMVRVYTTHGLPFDIQAVEIGRMVDEMNAGQLAMRGGRQKFGLWEVEAVAV